MSRAISIIAGCFLLSGHLGMAAETPMEAATRELGAKNILDYGATCSMSDEDKRTALGVKMTKTLQTMDFSKINGMASDIRTFSRNTGNLCDSLKNLQCQRTGRCGCANSEINGIRISSSREGTSCRLNRGSTCVPREALSMLGGQAPDLRCQAGTNCIVKRDRSTCTQRKMTEEIVSSIDMSRGFPDQATFMKKTLEKLKEGICECG